jgi:hypothetical protein
MEKENRHRIHSKVTINRPGHRNNGKQGVVEDVVHKGRLVHVINRPAPENTYLGDFTYDELVKGWNS